MDFTYEFVKIFLLGLMYAGPLLFSLVVAIAIIGQLIGRWEGWSSPDALYYAFITASTVGYGDFHPLRNVSKFWAVAIALLGLVLTGLVVALGVHAASSAFIVINPNAKDILSAL